MNVPKEVSTAATDPPTPEIAQGLRQQGFDVERALPAVGCVAERGGRRLHGAILSPG